MRLLSSYQPAFRVLVPALSLPPGFYEVSPRIKQFFNFYLSNYSTLFSFAYQNIIRMIPLHRPPLSPAISWLMPTSNSHPHPPFAFFFLPQMRIKEILSLSFLSVCTKVLLCRSLLTFPNFQISLITSSNPSSPSLLHFFFPIKRNEDLLCLSSSSMRLSALRLSTVDKCVSSKSFVSVFVSLSSVSHVSFSVSFLLVFC